MREFDWKTICEMTKKMFGHEVYGYWEFFNKDDAAKTILDHV